MYVDDINIVARVRNSEERDERTDMVNEVQGMAMFQRIGNSIDASIKLETDSPSKHRDGKMPLLDVKVWIEESKEKNQTEEEITQKETMKATVGVSCMNTTEKKWQAR